MAKLNKGIHQIWNPLQIIRWAQNTLNPAISCKFKFFLYFEVLSIIRPTNHPNKGVLKRKKYGDIEPGITLKIAISVNRTPMAQAIANTVHETKLSTKSLMVGLKAGLTCNFAHFLHLGTVVV